MATPPDRPLRFGGLLIPTSEWDTLVGRALELEAAGFDLVAVDDHIVNPARPDRRWFDAWTTLAALAARTERIHLAPLVANCVLREPAMLARQARSVDEISGGRLELGLGSGYAPTDHAAVQRPAWSGDERAERFAESTAVIRALLAGERAPAGVHHDVGELVIGPTGRRPPLIVAAHGPRALDVAARHADTWISFGGWGLSIDELIERWVDDFTKVGAVPILGDLDTSTGDLIDAVNASGVGVVGTPEMAIEQLRRLESQSGGYGTYLLMAHDWADRTATLSSYELFARYVMPVFQGSTRGLIESRDWTIENRSTFIGSATKAIQAATEQYRAERDAAAPSGAAGARG